MFSYVFATVHVDGDARSDDEKMSSEMKSRDFTSNPQSPHDNRPHLQRPDANRQRRRQTSGRHRKDGQRSQAGGRRTRVNVVASNNFSYNINNHTIYSTVSTNHSRVDVQVRRRLHFDNEAEKQDHGFRGPPQYHRMSPQEIMEKQERKLKEKEEEVENLHQELNMVYNALDKARTDRARLYNKMKHTEDDCITRMQNVYQDFSKFKNQTTELHRDLWDVANDDRERRQYERTLSRSRRQRPDRQQR